MLAYAASRQWVNALHGWVDEVNPAFWGRVQAFRLNKPDGQDLEFDLQAAHNLSEWVASPDWTGSQGEDGHWKGNGSGSLVGFAAFFARWTLSHDSLFVSEFKRRKVQRLLSDGLETDAPPASAPPPVPTVPLHRRAVIVRTLHVARTGFSLAKPDYYGRISVAGQTFLEATQRDRIRFDPAWTTIKFVPAPLGVAYPVRYGLWDQSLLGPDTHALITPDGYDLAFGFVTGSHLWLTEVPPDGEIVNLGVHDTPDTSFLTEHDGLFSDGAQVRLYVTDRALEEPPAAVPSSTAAYPGSLGLPVP